MSGRGLRLKFIFIFGEVVWHSEKCYSLAESLSRTSEKRLRRSPRPVLRAARHHALAQISSHEWPARRVHQDPARFPGRFGFARPAHRRQPIPSTSPFPAVWLRALRRCTEDRGSSRNWEGSDVRVRTIVSFALSRTGALVIAHPAFLARSESVILALACRVRIILHPRNTQVCDGHRQLRCAGIKYGSRDRKHGLRVHGTAWRSKWQGEPGARNPCLAGPGSSSPPPLFLPSEGRPNWLSSGVRNKVRLRWGSIAGPAKGAPSSPNFQTIVE